MISFCILLVIRTGSLVKAAIAEHLGAMNMDIADNYDFIYTHIKNLRKKLVQAGSPDYITIMFTVWVIKLSLPH
jgi:DNA-binding response OmpR family regulator